MTQFARVVAIAASVFEAGLCSDAPSAAATDGEVPARQPDQEPERDARGVEHDGAVARQDGSASIVLSKPFDSPDDVARIVREASGEDGPLRLRASRSKGR